MREIARVLVLAGLATAFLAPAVGADESRKITVLAKKFEFSPARIELTAGEPVEITFESEDVAHGFSAKGLGVQKVTFKKGKPATVRFTPEKPGSYRFRCSRLCGLGHFNMKGEIVVAPAQAR